MTYNDLAFKWLERILLALLVVAVIGIAIVSIARARQRVAVTDNYIEYLDKKFGW